MAFGDIQEAMTSRLGGKKKRPAPAASGGGEEPADGDVTVEVDEPGDAAETDMSSYGDVEDSAAADMFDAVKNGDREAFKSALSDFVDSCVQRQLKESK